MSLKSRFGIGQEIAQAHMIDLLLKKPITIPKIWKVIIHFNYTQSRTSVDVYLVAFQTRMQDLELRWDRAS